MKIIKIFDGVVTLRKLDRYFYSVGQAIAIVILGLMCGLKNLKQIHEWATVEPVRTFLIIGAGNNVLGDGNYYIRR